MNSLNKSVDPTYSCSPTATHYRVAMELNANKVKVFAKAGDIAMNDILLSAGNTGLSPGPLIGKFGALGVRTRIEAGNIWIATDATVCKKGAGDQ